MLELFDGQKLRDARKKKQLTQKRLAAESLVSEEQLRRLENGGVQVLKDGAIKKVIDALEIDAPDLYPESSFKVIDTPNFLVYFLSTVDCLRIDIDLLARKPGWEYRTLEAIDELVDVVRERVCYSDSEWSDRIRAIWSRLFKTRTGIVYRNKFFSRKLYESEEEKPDWLDPSELNNFHIENIAQAFFFKQRDADGLFKAIKSENENNFDVYPHLFDGDFMKHRSPYENSPYNPHVAFDIELQHSASRELERIRRKKLSRKFHDYNDDF